MADAMSYSEEMGRLSTSGTQLFASVVASVLLSTGLTWILRLILSTVTEPPKPHDPGSPSHGRGPNINPVAVFVIMPILIKNQFGPRRAGRRRLWAGPTRK